MADFVYPTRRIWYLEIYNARIDSLGSKAEGAFSLRDLFAQFGAESLDTDRQIRTTNISTSDWDHRLPVFEGQYRPDPANCSCIRCFLRSLDFSHIDCIVLVISSPGVDDSGGEILFRFQDGYLLPVSEIYDALSDESCPGLRDKARIIIAQAYRPGAVEDRGVMVDVKPDAAQTFSGYQVSAEYDGQMIKSHGQSELPVCEEPQRTRFNPMALPTDFLVVYPSISGHYASRDAFAGSWLEEEMLNTLHSEYFALKPEVDFLKFLTMVASRVARRENLTTGEKTALCVMNRLAKRILLKRK